MTLIKNNLIAAISSAKRKYVRKADLSQDFLDGIEAGAKEMFEIANAEMSEIEDERDKLETQAEHAPNVQTLADIQKAEIAKRLVANMTIEQMEALEISAFNLCRIHGGRYTTGNDIIPHALQQLVDSQK